MANWVRDHDKLGQEPWQIGSGTMTNWIRDHGKLGQGPQAPWPIGSGTMANWIRDHGKFGQGPWQIGYSLSRNKPKHISIIASRYKCH